MSAFTPAGSGGVTTTIQITGATNPQVANVSMPMAGTEYSFTLPTNTKQYAIKLRGSGRIQIAYVAGQSSTLYYTIPRYCYASESDLSLSASLDLFFQSDLAAQVAEIWYWI
jgi:hypothetical protein